jgi:hypothetical protein
MTRRYIKIPLRNCEVCKSLIPRNTKSWQKRVSPKQYSKSRFCSLKCKGLWQSKNVTGSLCPNFRGGNDKCYDCKIDLGHRYCRKNDKPRCRKCYYLFNRGANNPCWKGGIGFPKCVNCSGKTGDFNSVLCRKCYRGALSHFWNGGTSPMASLIRALPENRQWIKQCMYRDNYICQECGVESFKQNLQVHHIKRFAVIIKENNIKSLEEARKCDELWDTDNGKTLCKDCHRLVESFNKIKKIK